MNSVKPTRCRRERGRKLVGEGKREDRRRWVGNRAKEQL